MVIITPWGTFVYKRLAMGLRNSCQSFQKLCEWALAGIKNIYIYIDDILIFSKSEEEHLRTVEEVCSRLSQYDLTVSLKKCEFGVRMAQGCVSATSCLYVVTRDYFLFLSVPSLCLGRGISSLSSLLASVREASLSRKIHRDYVDKPSGCLLY